MGEKLKISNKNPVEVQEFYYKLPYHWFPDERLIEFKRIEKEELYLK